jgi:hypothetical protein
MKSMRYQIIVSPQYSINHRIPADRPLEFFQWILRFPNRGIALIARNVKCRIPRRMESEWRGSEISGIVSELAKPNEVKPSIIAFCFLLQLWKRSWQKTASRD